MFLCRAAAVRFAWASNADLPHSCFTRGADSHSTSELAYVTVRPRQKSNEPTIRYRQGLELHVGMAPSHSWRVLATLRPLASLLGEPRTTWQITDMAEDAYGYEHDHTINAWWGRCVLTSSRQDCVYIRDPHDAVALSSISLR